MGWAPGLLLEARGDAPLRLVLPERAVLAPAHSGAGWERSEGSSISWLTAIKTLWMRTCKALLTSCSQTSWAMNFCCCHSFCIVGNAEFHCSGGSWHPPQTHVLAHVFVFVFWNRKGWMLLSCPNKNPSVGAACLRSGARRAMCELTPRLALPLPGRCLPEVWALPAPQLAPCFWKIELLCQAVFMHHVVWQKFHCN